MSPTTAPTQPAGIRLRPGSVEDARAIADLVCRLDDHDDTGERLSTVQLVDLWQVPGLDPRRDVMVAVDEQGDVLGYAEVSPPSEPLKGETIVRIAGGVLPGARGLGIGTALMRWAGEHGRDRAAAERPGMAAVLSAWGYRQDCDATDLLVNEGYTVERWFADMRLDTDTWERPAGVGEASAVSRAVAWPDDAAALLSARNEAFADHWSAPPTSPERWAALFGRSTFRPDLSRPVVRAGDTGDEAEVEAFVMSEEWEPGELYIALVGTRRGARGRGPATGLLVEVVEAARAAGMHRVELGVDASSPTGANAVYERIGFRTVRTGVQLHRRTEPSAGPVSARAEPPRP